MPGATQNRTSISGLLGGLQNQFDQFNQAGQEQFGQIQGITNAANQQILGEGGLFSQAGGLLDSLGQRQKRRIGEQKQQALGQSEQNLVSSGLNNTTMRQNARRGIRRDADDAQQDLSERVNTARAGLLERQAAMEDQRANTTVDTELSKQNVPPNVEKFSGLLQQMSGAGGEVADLPSGLEAQDALAGGDAAPEAGVEDKPSPAEVKKAEREKARQRRKEEQERKRQQEDIKRGARQRAARASNPNTSDRRLSRDAQNAASAAERFNQRFHGNSNSNSGSSPAVAPASSTQRNTSRRRSYPHGGRVIEGN